MFEKIANIFRIPDLRKRVLFTLGILAVYRLGSQIPTPGVNLKLLAQFFDQQAGSALGLVDLFSGGNLRRLTIFALGIMPYITASIMWLGEQITARGIGNGMSLLIFAGIVVGLPRGIQDLIDKAKTQAWGAFTIPALLILVCMMIAIVAFIVFVERSERRIPVQYAKRIVGRRLMGGQSTHLPLKVNSA